MFLKPDIEKIPSKKRNGFRSKRSTILQILTTHRIRAKNLVAILLFVDFSRVFDSIQRDKMEQILQAYGFPKETITVIWILLRNIKEKVRSSVEDTDFDIVTCVLQGDTFASYLFIIYLHTSNIDKSY